MPIYEYRCTVCGHQFDVIQKINDPQVSRCERCGKTVRRVISPSGIVFKGSGWYVTDYGTRKKDDRKKSGSDNTVKTDKNAAQPAAAPEGSDKKTASTTTGDATPKADQSKATSAKADSAKRRTPAS